jgi:hypothetical protein
MTIKAIDIVQARSKGKGWFIMSEAASIVSVIFLYESAATES